MRASGDRDCGRPRVACGPREVGHASEEREEKREGKKEGKRKGGIRGGRSRRVALDGTEMGRGLKSGVGSDLRGSGDRSRRVPGKLGLGSESSSTTKTNLAHDFLGEFLGCYTGAGPAAGEERSRRNRRRELSLPPGRPCRLDSTVARDKDGSELQ